MRTTRVCVCVYAREETAAGETAIRREEQKENEEERERKRRR